MRHCTRALTPLDEVDKVPIRDGKPREMMLLWGIAGVSLVASVASWMQARRTSRQLAQLTERYWELRYQHGELRAQVQRELGTGPEPVSPLPRPAEAFVPLASVKR